MHDMVGPTSIIDEVLANFNLDRPIQNIGDLITSLQSSVNPPAKLPRTKVVTVYTYSDAPTSPKRLSGRPKFWSTAKRSLFDHLLSMSKSEDRITLLQMCKVGVILPGVCKNADDSANSESFRSIMDCLHKQQIVLVLAPDSAGTIGFILPPSNATKTVDGDEKYFALWYYTNIKEFISWAKEKCKESTAHVAAAASALTDAAPLMPPVPQPPALLVSAGVFMQYGESSASSVRSASTSCDPSVLTMPSMPTVEQRLRKASAGTARVCVPPNLASAASTSAFVMPPASEQRHQLDNRHSTPSKSANEHPANDNANRTGSAANPDSNRVNTSVDINTLNEMLRNREIEDLLCGDCGEENGESTHLSVKAQIICILSL